MCIITIALKRKFHSNPHHGPHSPTKAGSSAPCAFTSYQAPDSSCCTRIRVRLFCFMKPSFFCPPSIPFFS